MEKTTWYVKIDGGIGRCIAATGAIEEFAKRKSEQGDAVGIVTSYPQMFEGLEYVDRIYTIGMQYLYEDYISKGEFIEPEPYNSSKYYKEEKHLAQVFNFLLNGEDKMILPKLNLSENELAMAKAFIENERATHGKKIVLVQPWGSTGGRMIQTNGANPNMQMQQNPNMPMQGNPNMQMMPMQMQQNQVCENGCGSGAVSNAQKPQYKVMNDETFRSFGTEFGEELNKKLLAAGYQTYLVKLPEQVGFNGSKTFNKLSPRQIIALIPFVDGIVSCDSFISHASAALGTPVPTIVLWAGTNEKNLGYKSQVNFGSWKKTIYEPNRIPHNHEYYVNKNKDSNEFKLELIDKIIEELNAKK